MTTKHVALVTGGMGGIGEAIAKVLHDAGDTVLVTHSPCNDRVGAWLDHQASSGYQYKAYPVDVAEFASCQRMAEAIAKDGHKVDILINNAGITRDGRFLKMSKDDWEAVMHTNLDSMFNVTKQFCGGMVEQGWGRIVNIGSINGTRGQFGQCNYAATKAGIHGFSESLALEVARHGVTVNTVSPGYTATRMVSAVPKEVLESKIIPLIPVGRLGQPEEIAALVGFICSDSAAFMTGSNVAMNGGQHMY
ncbi:MULTISPECIES: acetoacetyl-CoA reductase [unclassified Rhodanobacter]|uniref:acetoacetyl-CoA reductase n=1 Tax=unclassified Rhodanobacter TaxID=2621553 RepID=UPI00098769FE|nr:MULTISPECIES: acetoacetyl-CoA reductase [unclassified Rhodanobacter]OOG38583.1 beta-ketoacyl-ACP reductase [Rhodanobacter sp. C05]OOG50078.1 beta-ketoacyl-ACP reductase [Rhodanobacter sp. C01]OOG52266.1 beta-ketoacyl-ACP reductase [Rhodanobacter sp. C03]